MARYQPYISGSTLNYAGGGQYYVTTSSASSSISWNAPAAAPPREPTALEWLDREIEGTCAKARA